MVRAIICFLVITLSLSASSGNFGPRDLIIDDFNSSSPKNIDAYQVHMDLQFLIFALQNAYGGYPFLSDHIKENLLSRLSTISQMGAMPVHKFCDQIGDALWVVPDAHLRSILEGKICGIQRTKDERDARVGVNLGEGSAKPFLFDTQRVGDKQIRILAITDLPMTDEPVWAGYSESLPSLLEASAVIIDLRGLPGGDDRRGIELAQLLTGKKITTLDGLQRVHVSQKPGTFALRLNLFEIYKARLIETGENVPEYLNQVIAENKKNFEAAIRGELEEMKVSNFPEFSVSDKELAYKGPIYVLIDAKCGSACESTIGALKLHPHVVLIGENTRGITHFGNEGVIQLPESKVFVRMPTKYNEYKHFIEKVGHEPDIKLAPDTNAFEFVLNLLKGRP